jgi:nitrogen fixation protein FixH
MKEFTGRKMLALMVAFFTVVIGVNVLLAVMANRSWSGLVVANSFDASQHFNKETALLKQAESLDVKADTSYGAGVITVVLQTVEGQPVNLSGMTAKLGRPTHEGEDQTINLICDQAGVCKSAASLSPGVWSGELEAEIPDKGHWIKMIRLTVAQG